MSSSWQSRSRRTNERFSKWTLPARYTHAITVPCSVSGSHKLGRHTSIQIYSKILQAHFGPTRIMANTKFSSGCSFFGGHSLKLFFDRGRRRSFYFDIASQSHLSNLFLIIFLFSFREWNDNRGSMRSVVVAQLVDQLLPISEVRSSNLVIGKIYIEQCLLSTVLNRRKRKKEAENSSRKIRHTVP